MGLAATLWDGPLLSEYLRCRYGVDPGVRQCQRLFRQMGLRLRNPAPSRSGRSAESRGGKKLRRLTRRADVKLWNESDDIWSRLRLEHRTLTSCAAALVSIALHALFVGPALWAGGTPQHPADRKYAGGTAMQWIVLDDSPTVAEARLVSSASPVLAAINLSDVLSALPASGVSAAKDTQSADSSSLGLMYGRYVGQIHARIDRAWQRPRTSIGASIFQCQVQVDQDSVGRVDQITLLQCNGNTRWRLSLVHAIEAASPLPAPPNPAVFARHIILEFRAMAYSRDADAELYEPAAAGMRVASGEADKQPQNLFQAFQEAASASHSRRIIELRIEGSKVEVEPEHQ